jgi:hypothetical protein
MNAIDPLVEQKVIETIQLLGDGDKFEKRLATLKAAADAADKNARRAGVG